ncbi:MAG: hypothetical protein U0640_14135 [Phycisphaerales bacterium]
MNVLPRRIQDQLDWFDQHAPVWQHAATRPLNIGISPTQAAAFADLAQAARRAHEEQLAALEAARIATQRMQAAVDAAHEMASDLIANVKATAATSKHASAVYHAAQVPAPRASRPGTMDAPGKPVIHSVELEPATGALTIRWNARQPANAKNTVYVVKRRVLSASLSRNIEAFEFVGITGDKHFTDTPPTPPLLSGTAAPSIEYIVQAQRGTSVGEVSDVFVVNIGAAAQTAKTNALRLAA